MPAAGNGKKPLGFERKDLLKEKVFAREAGNERKTFARKTFLIWVDPEKDHHMKTVTHPPGINVPIMDVNTGTKEWIKFGNIFGMAIDDGTPAFMQFSEGNKVQIDSKKELGILRHKQSEGIPRLQKCTSRTC